MSVFALLDVQSGYLSFFDWCRRRSVVGVSAVFVLGSSRLHLPGCGPAVAALGGSRAARWKLMVFHAVSVMQIPPKHLA